MRQRQQIRMMVSPRSRGARKEIANLLRRVEPRVFLGALKEGA
jgi:hypothetical protein